MQNVSFRSFLIALCLAMAAFFATASESFAVINVSVAPGGTVDIVIDNFKPVHTGGWGAFTYLGIAGPFARGTTYRVSMNGISVDAWGSGNFNGTSPSNRVYSGEVLRYTNDGTGLNTTVSISGTWGNGMDTQAETINILITNSGASVLSINMLDPNPTVAASVRWQVKFDQPVTGVNAGNFQLSGGVTGAAITGVSGSGDTWTVTAGTGTGTGLFGLNMVNSTGVNPQVLGLTFTGQPYSFQTYPTVTTDIANAIVVSGQKATFSVTAGSRDASASDPINYQWYNGPVGNRSAGYQIAGASGSSTTSPFTTSYTTGVLTSTPANGFWVDFWNNDTWHVTSSLGTATVYSPPTITGQPAGKTVCAGDTTSFAAGASGSGITYQWQVNNGSGFGDITDGGSYSGAGTPTLTITGATAGMNGYSYRLYVSGLYGTSATSNGASLTVNTAPTITAQPADKSICAGNNTSFLVTASGSGLTYQWQVNSGSGFSNIVNTGPYTNATTSTLNITGATAGLTGNSYRVAVSGICAPVATSNAAGLTVNTAPSITSQPVSATLYAGGSTSFIVNSSGSGVNYQWQVNSGSGFSNITDGGSYAGTTTNSLNINNASLDMNGYSYQAVATGACAPAAISNPAALTINPVPIVTGITIDQTMPNIQYSGIDGIGVYLSSNGGASWTAATGQPANKRVKALVIHPTTRTTLYAATYGNGIYVSNNSGDTWSACANGGLSGAALNAVFLVVDTNGKLYAGTEAGIFTSSDCTSWSPVNNGLTVSAATPPVALAIDPTTPANVYTGLDGAGVFISANSGGLWTAATTQPTNLRVKALVIKPGDSTKLYAATYGGGIFQSANSGLAWIACAGQPTNQNVISLTIDATGRLYAGTEAGVFLSNDNCASWNALNTGLPL